MVGGGAAASTVHPGSVNSAASAGDRSNSREERIISSDAETAAIKGTRHFVNAEYSRKLSIGVWDGLREKFEAGFVNGHVPSVGGVCPTTVRFGLSSPKPPPSSS